MTWLLDILLCLTPILHMHKPLVLNAHVTTLIHDLAVCRIADSGISQAGVIHLARWKACMRGVLGSMINSTLRNSPSLRKCLFWARF